MNRRSFRTHETSHFILVPPPPGGHNILIPKFSKGGNPKNDILCLVINIGPVLARNQHLQISKIQQIQTWKVQTIRYTDLPTTLEFQILRYENNMFKDVPMISSMF